MINKTIIHLVWIICLIIISPCFGNESKFQLSPEEKIWINQNHTVRVRIGSAPPFILTDGKIRGMAIDYLTYIFNQHGIKIHYIQESEVTWPQALKYIEQHDVVDMVPTAKITDDRKKRMLFTDEYILAPWVIFTRSKADFIGSIEDLKGKTVSVEEGYVIHEKLKRDYPQIKLKIVSAKLQNYAEMPIKDLSTGLVDGYIGNLIMTTYMIQSKGYTNIKVAAPTPFDNHNQAMAVRNDWPELVSIINKTLAGMTPDEHATILNRWLSIRYEYGINKADVIKWVLSIAGVAAISILFVLIWNRRLKKEVAFRKKIEKSQRATNARHSAMVANIGDVIGIMGADGIMKYKSPNIERWFGWKPEDLVGTDGWETVHPEDIERVQKTFYTLIEKDNASTTIEYRYKCKDGTYAWIGLTAVNRINDTTIKGILLNYRDISGRKKTEKSLKNNRNFLNRVIDQSPFAIWVSDEKGTIIKCNLALTKLLNITDEQLIGKYNVFEDEIAIEQGLIPKIRTVFEDGKTANFSVEWDANKLGYKDAQKVHIEGTMFPIHNDKGDLTNVVNHWVDITKRKQAEKTKTQLEVQLQQAQKMESIGTLAGGVAHDFNNLLYMIVGNTELALEDIPKWNPAYTNLEEIKSASLRAAGIVKQLLTFSRKTDQKLIPIDAVTVIKDSLKFLRSTISTSVEIHEHMPDDEIVILADSTQINQIMMNLCINASQAMEETGGILEVSIEKTICEAEDIKEFSDLVPGNYLKITVNDTGPGISPETINQIFDPYFTTKDIGKGSGMGLSIVHGIVKNYNGAISFDSNPGKGTTFSILIPVIDKKPEIGTEIIDKIPRGHESILFIDDEHAITDMNQKILEKLGYRVEARLNPIEALDLFKLNPDTFDLVITDMTMPQMTGDKLSEKLKEIRSDIPIIICTGHSSLIDEEKAKIFGIDGYLMKPASMSTIAKAIRNVLDK